MSEAPAFHGRVWRSLRESVLRGIPPEAMELLGSASVLWETDDRSAPDRIIVGFFAPGALSPTVMINIMLDENGEETGHIDAIARREGPDREMPSYIVKSIDEVAEIMRRKRH